MVTRAETAPPRWAWPGAIAICAVLLAGACFWNGYPFVFSDLGAQHVAGLTLEQSAFYGSWIRLTAFGRSLWGVALAQSLLLATLLIASLRRLGPSRPWRSTLTTCLLVAIATSAPYVSGLVLPDVFLPAGLLALGLLLLGTSRRTSNIALAAVVVASALSAFSHLCILTLATLTGLFVTRRAGRLQGAWRRWGLLSLIGICWLAAPTFNALAGAGFRWAATPSTLADSTPHGPGRAKGQAEQFGLRLLSFGIDRNVYAPVAGESAFASELGHRYPRDLPRFAAARQQNLTIGDVSGRESLQILLLMAALYALGRGLQRDRLSDEAKLFGAVVTSGVVGAALASAVSGLPDGARSGARVTWLLPLLALATVADPLELRDSAQRWWRELTGPSTADRRGWLRSLARWLRDAHEANPLLRWSTVAICLKLLLAHATFGTGFELPAPTHWLKDALTGLVHGTFSELLGPIYLVTLGTSLLLTGWTLLLPRRASRVAVVAVNVFISLLAFSDAVYCRYFHDFLSVPAILQAGQVGELGGCIQALLQWSDLLFVADLGVVGWLAWRRRRAPAGSSIVVGFPRRLGQCGAALAIAAVLTGAPIHRGLEKNPGLITNPWSRSTLYGFVGLIGLHAIEATQYVDQRVFEKDLPPDRVAELHRWFDDRARLRTGTTPFTGLAKGKNVIVIQMESFQDFLVGKKLAGQAITPNLDALLPELTYVPNYYHQTAQGRTSDAEFASNCSLLPLDFGSAYIRFPDDRFVCLAKVLHDAGYETAAFHGNEGAFYNRYYVYPRIGFDRFFSLADFALDHRVGWALGDREFFAQSVAKMKSLRKPFYAFLITLTSHYPYDLPDSEKTLPLGPLTPGLVADYVQSVHYLDSAIGQLVTELKRQGLWDDSVVLMYGDHDDGIPDDDPNYARILGHAPDPVDRMNLAYRVGLFIHLPGQPPRGTIETVGAQTDLAPTVLDALGISSVRLPWLGEPVLAPHEGLLPLRFGSFASDQMLYLSAGSACIDRVHRIELPAESCAEGEAQAIARLNRSESVIAHDLQLAMSPSPEAAP